MPHVPAVEGAGKGSSCCLLLPALLPLGESSARHRGLSITVQTSSCLHRTLGNRR